MRISDWSSDVCSSDLLEDVERSEGEDIGLRVFSGRRSATVSSSDMSEEALAKLAERALAMAREAPEDEYAGLAPEEMLLRKKPGGLALADRNDPEPQELKDSALIADEAARDVMGVSKSERSEDRRVGNGGVGKV